ncbi:MAG: phosphohistidine phosphatase SixA [Candidatus Omnitrophica bacterium]|nr:phosphohistidine phosphatase SixA [Candidatus Omnitrophota bacterium]
MKLFLLRHGIAENQNPLYFPEDSKRPLTEKGKKEVRKVAQKMRDLEFKIDLILSSPFVRAKQTAEIAAEMYKKSPLEFSEHLACGGSAGALMKELKTRYQKRENILIVGHEPYLSNLASVLISGKPIANIDLKKAGLIVLKVDEELRLGPCATLKLFISPKYFLQIG